jgi:hypothetical protein
VVAVANQGIFGQGVFSMRGEAIARMIGTKRIQPYHIRIAKPKGTVLCPDGVRRNGVTLPFMPKKLTDEFHPGGNSLCYSIQLAHLMGCEEVFLHAFTLKSGSSYFFGGKNPVTRRSTLYDARRALDWLAWYRKTWPGRAKLVAGWDGPVYEVLETISQDELLQRSERQGQRPPAFEPKPRGEEPASGWHL